MGSVTEITGNEFQKGGKDLITQVSEYFSSQNNKTTNGELGEITFDRRGIKDDIAHGIGRKKAASFAAVPNVIKDGKVVDYQENWKGRGYDTAVIAAPIDIDGKKHYMGIVVMRENNGSRFYVHEVLSIEKGTVPFKTGTVQDGTPGGNAPSVISILQKIANVNTDAEKTSAEYRRKQAREIDELLRKEVKDYASLSESNKGMTRKLVRDARANGIPEADILTYARLSAHSGIQIVFDKEANFNENADAYSPGHYDPNTDRIVINPDKKCSTDKLLAHEGFHDMVAHVGGAKKWKALLKVVKKNMSESERQEIKDSYKKLYNVEEGDVLNEEYVGNYAQQHVNKGFMEFLLAEKPSLKERILGFFKGAITDYKSDERLSRSAKKFYRAYKKMFDSFAEQNRNNAASEEIWTRKQTDEGKRWATDKSFSEQIDDVIEGVHNPRYDLYVSETPKELMGVNMPKGPLLMRNGKIKEILEKHPEMSEELLKKIPEAIADPILIIKSKTHPTESVVVITDIMTSKGEMIVPVWVAQEGNYLDVELGDLVLDTNFVASAYGRKVKALIETAIEDNGVFYQNPDEKRVKNLLARNGLQLSTPLKISNSTIIIPDSGEKVNGFEEKSFDKGEKKSDSGKRWAYAGEKSETADIELLEEAKALEASGVERNRIRLKTGWFKWYDGMWRYEISDEKMEYLHPEYVDGKYTTLGQMIEHEKLLKAYPQLRDVKVELVPTDPEALEKGANYNPYTNTIKYPDVCRRKGKMSKQDKALLIHEVQHAIQKIEGFSRGSNPEILKNKLTKEYEADLKKWDTLMQEILDDASEDYGDDAGELIKSYYRYRDEYRKGKKEASKVRDVRKLAEINKRLDKIRETIYDVEDEIYIRGLSLAFNQYSSARKGKQELQADIKNKAQLLYLKTSGEKEARNVEKRVGLTDQERIEKEPLWNFEDINFSEELYDGRALRPYVENTNSTEVASEPEKKKMFALPEGDEEGTRLSAEQREFFKDTKVVSENGYILPVARSNQKGGAIWLHEHQRSDGEKLYARLENPIETGSLEKKAFKEVSGNRLPSKSIQDIAGQLGCNVSEIMSIVLRGKCVTIRDLVSQKEFTALCLKYGKDGIIAQDGKNTRYDVAPTVFAVFDNKQLRKVTIKSPRTHQKALTQAATTGYNDFIHKNFPPDNEIYNESHRLAVWWARRNNVFVGAQTVIYVDGTPYLVEKFDDALNYYQVEKLLTDDEVKAIYKEIGDNVRDKQKQSVQGVIDRFNLRNKSRGTNVNGKSGVDSDNSGHRGENNPIQGLDSNEVTTEQQARYDGDGNNERGDGVYTSGTGDTDGLNGKRFALPEEIKVEKTPTAASVKTEKKDVYQRSAGEAVRDMSLATQVALINEQAGVEWYLKQAGMSERNAQIVSQLARASGSMGNNAAMVAQFDFSDKYRKGIAKCYPLLVFENYL